MFEVNIKHKHSIEDVIDLLSTGLEGGINYWASVCLEGGENYYDIKHPDWCITVYDNETDDVLGKLNMTSLQSGLESMSNIARSHYNNFLIEDCDAETGDVFIQCCLFNELVYG
tara:strand:- start:155 stop:496 length:342 start_codon:yes stop_codon:yes gene_type:complete